MSTTKHFLVYNISSWFIPLTGLILFPLYTHYLTPSDYGIRTIVLLAILIFQVFTNFGLNWVIRSTYFDITETYERQSYNFTLSITSLSARFLVFVVLYYQAPLIFPYFFKSWDNLYTDLFRLQLFVYLTNFSSEIFNALYVMNKYSSAWTMTNLIILFTNHGVALILLIVYDMGVHSLFYAELISYLVYTIISIYILSSYFRFSFTPRAIDDIIHIGLFAVPQNLFGLIQRNISKYMLQIFMPVNALGLYTRSEIIHIGFKSFSKSFNNAVSPKYIENKKKNGEDSSIHHTMIYWLFFLSTIQLFFILFLMDIFKLVKVNEAFWDCAIYAPILGMVIIISSYNLPYNNNILVSKKTYLYTIRAIIGGILMIILAYYLIPKIGIIGAIIPILVSSFIHMFTEYFFSEHYLNNKTVINLRIYFLVLIFLFIVITLPFLGFTFTLISKCFIFSTYLLFLAVYEKRYLYGKVFHSINSFSV